MQSVLPLARPPRPATAKETAQHTTKHVTKRIKVWNREIGEHSEVLVLTFAELSTTEMPAPRLPGVQCFSPKHLSGGSIQDREVREIERYVRSRGT